MEKTQVHRTSRREIFCTLRLVNAKWHLIMLSYSRVIKFFKWYDDKKKVVKQSELSPSEKELNDEIFLTGNERHAASLAVLIGISKLLPSFFIFHLSEKAENELIRFCLLACMVYSTNLSVFPSEIWAVYCFEYKKADKYHCLVPVIFHITCFAWPEISWPVNSALCIPREKRLLKQFY